MRRVELSHVVHDGLVTYPGLPAPVIRDHLSRAESRARYAPGTEFQIARIEMVANTGTYVDAPSHRFDGAADLAGLPLESLADLEALVVRVAPEVRAVDAAPADVRGRAVLFHTGWDRHFGTPRYAQGHPYLTRAAAERLRDGGAALVGIDSLNIDDTADGSRPVHTALLAAGVPVVEHLTGLAALPERGARFFAAPPRVRGMGTFPVRAFALVPEPAGRAPLVGRWYSDMWNRWDEAVAREICAPDVELRGSLGQTHRGPDGIAAYMRFVRAAFPDFHNEVEELVEEGDRVFARLRYTATHRGEVFGLAPTGRRVEYAGAALFTFGDERIRRVWVLGDVDGLKRQLAP
jgi:kynurenine formamidase/predicted ester cyclase